MDPGESAEGRGEVAIGPRVIGGPTRAAFRPIEVAVAAVAAVTAPMNAWHGRIHQPGEGPLGFFLVIGRKREVLIFAARVFPEWTLEGEERGEQTGASQQQPC